VLGRYSLYLADAPATWLPSCVFSTYTAISVPAVTPEDVKKGPSCTQRAARTQFTLGPVDVTHSQAILLLVALQVARTAARATIEWRSEASEQGFKRSRRHLHKAAKL
jgi:hypothetical protein